ncbi:MAG: hypothetical protein HQK77_02770 [Desulfobacterales bacterium]|nr:hypothetical protein [Desulfobacterales bacterium]
MQTQVTEMNNQQFEAYVKKIVLETVQQIINEAPPKSEIAILLHLHIKDMQDFKQRVEDKLEKLENDIKRIQLDIDDRFDKVDDRLDKMDVRFNNIETRLDKMDDRFNNVETRLDRIESEMMTKSFWHEEKNRLLFGIGQEFQKIVSQLLEKKDETTNFQ